MANAHRKIRESIRAARLNKRLRPARSLTVAALFVLSTFSSVFAGAIDIDHPPQGRFNDDWAEIHLGGSKSGYAHSTMARQGDRIQTQMTMKLRVGRTGQFVELSVVQDTEETVRGEPLSFRTVMDMATAKMTTEGTIREGKVEVRTSQFGMEQKQTYDFPTGALMTWGMFRESVKRGFKPGTAYTLSTYAADLRLDGAITVKTVVGDWESFPHRGRTMRGQRVTATMEAPNGSIEMITWVDEDGEAVKAKVPIAGLADLEIITTDQATAVSDFVPPEIFMTTVIPVKRSLDREAVRRIRYRLTPKGEGESAKLELPTTGMQRTLRRDGHAIELEVTRQRHVAAPDAKGTNRNQPDLDEFLQPNLIINSADPKLMEIARDAAGSEKEPFALGDRLRRFVTDFVTGKNMNVGFATASEVARVKEGDCSEHAVLLAALGRINGLPSRVVVGLAYAPFFGGKDDIFGYHMWTQFFIAGEWYDFDAALRETEVSPARIVFATSSLKNAGLADLSFALLSSIGSLDLVILEAETGKNAASTPEK